MINGLSFRSIRFTYKRTLNHYSIYRENLKSSKQARRRLQVIDARIAHLDSSHDHIISNLRSKSIDLVTIISARNQYEKELRLLEKQSPVGAADKRELFYRVTESVRNRYISDATSRPMCSNLVTNTKAREDIDDLLIQVFTLSTIEKNHVMINLKEHRDLTQEKAALNHTNHLHAIHTLPLTPNAAQ